MKGIVYAILSFGFLVGSIAANGAKSRIIGGEDARIEDYPYQASLRLHGQHFCGGTIIGPRHILTAGHCLKGKMSLPFTIHTGTMSSRNIGYQRRIHSITIHNGYEGTDESSDHHDIALIELADAIKYDETQQPIPLASRQVVGGEKADFTGWGYESSNSVGAALVLQHTMTKILARKVCVKSMKDNIYEEQICAFRNLGIGACNGDSGGPLVVDGELVGVLSRVDGDICANGTAEIYTNVYLYRDWIKEHMN